MKEICDKLEAEARKLGIKTIITTEPPTPSGWGVVKRAYIFEPNGVRFMRWNDTKGWHREEKYSSLYELFANWWQPNEEIVNIAKAIRIKQGQKPDI